MQAEILQLGPENVGEEVTSQEFATADFAAPYRYERVKGRLVVMSPAGPEHRAGTRVICRELFVYWHQHPSVVDFVDGEGWLSVSDETDRLPDVCVYLAGPQTGKDVPHRIPEIIFEVVSSSRTDRDRDYLQKREEYQTVGVREYVIVDRFRQQAIVLTWQEEGYAQQLLGAEDVYVSPLLPGLEVSLREVIGK